MLPDRRHPLLLLLLQRRNLSASKSRSGTPSLSGLGVRSSNLNPKFTIERVVIILFSYCVCKMNLIIFVGSFRADIVVDNCAICRNHIMDLCECF